MIHVLWDGSINQKKVGTALLAQHFHHLDGAKCPIGAKTLCLFALFRCTQESFNFSITVGLMSKLPSPWGTRGNKRSTVGWNFLPRTALTTIKKDSHTFELHHWHYWSQHGWAHNLLQHLVQAVAEDQMTSTTAVGVQRTQRELPKKAQKWVTNVVKWKS